MGYYDFDNWIVAKDKQFVINLLVSNGYKYDDVSNVMRDVRYAVRPLSEYELSDLVDYCIELLQADGIEPVKPKETRLVEVDVTTFSDNLPVKELVEVPVENPNFTAKPQEKKKTGRPKKEN